MESLAVEHITAEQARAMRATFYTMREIMDHIRRCAPDSSRVYGYKAERMPHDLVKALRGYGYTVHRDDEGNYVIEW